MLGYSLRLIVCRFDDGEPWIEVSLVEILGGRVRSCILIWESSTNLAMWFLYACDPSSLVTGTDSLEEVK